MSRTKKDSASGASGEKITPLPEELFDRAIGIVEGPVNRAAERVFKSKIVLAPMGLWWTATCRSILALRHRRPSVMWRGVDALEDQ